MLQTLTLGLAGIKWSISPVYVGVERNIILHPVRRWQPTIYAFEIPRTALVLETQYNTEGVQKARIK